jgi:hypothetical protein
MFLLGTGAALMLTVGFVASRAQDTSQGTLPDLFDSQSPVSDPICTFFGPDHDKFVPAADTSDGMRTQQVARRLAPADEVMRAAAMAVTIPSAPGGSRTDTAQRPSANTIDRYIFPALAAANVAPAPPTTDFEFIRRLTLDLTGRIPAADQVVAFVNDPAPNKRAALIESLLASPNWVDKWTVWFGDLYQNNSRNTQIPRFIQGVTGLNTYIRNSLTANKPYDQMAREIIGAEGSDSYTQGELNFLVGGVVTGGPVQDIFDQQTANTVQTFLGISHMNCLLCHNGRGHLDALSLWGYETTRQQAWGMASFLSRTNTPRTPVSGAVNGQPYYWGLVDNTRYKTDYQLNTQTGNRPPRGATNSNVTVPPVYIFDGTGPNPGENYRAALARKITSDFQFARAAVNYIWEYFFTIGIVSPSNQFDPLRLDPNNPPSNCPSPSNPCTLQPSNAALLNALALDFINNKYDLKSVMREIVNSQTYQLSSRYNGAWSPATQNLFGRKLVRRLWSEEIHDAITQSSGVIPTYNNPNWGPVSWAMQLPEPLNTPDGNGAVATFLNAFLRGNRDDQPRRPDGSISQALSLMNDNFVMSRIRTAAPATSLLVQALKLPDDQMVNTLFLSVLSRYPTSTEMSAALANLKTNRTQEAQNLLWSLYNKVDFVFNY